MVPKNSKKKGGVPTGGETFSRRGDLNGEKDGSLYVLSTKKNREEGKVERGGSSKGACRAVKDIHTEMGQAPEKTVGWGGCSRGGLIMK